MQDIERWMRNPTPAKLFETMLHEVVQHFGIVRDAFWYVCEDSQGRLLEVRPMHPDLTRIVASKRGEVLDYGTPYP